MKGAAAGPRRGRRRRTAPPRMRSTSAANISSNGHYIVHAVPHRRLVQRDVLADEHADADARQIEVVQELNQGWQLCGSSCSARSRRKPARAACPADPQHGGAGGECQAPKTGQGSPGGCRAGRQCQSSVQAHASALQADSRGEIGEPTSSS